MSELRDSLVAAYRDDPEGILAALKTARPVSLRSADVMLFMIDKGTNKSKFYEMSVVAYGAESSAKKTQDFSNGSAQWVLQRRWGRLTDSGKTGRVDSINVLFDTERRATRALHELQYEKEKKGYRNVTRDGSYPIGLGGAGFGWGGQAVCRVIPELQELKGHVDAALAMLRPLARTDSEVAQELNRMLNPVQKYLERQLAECRD